MKIKQKGRDLNKREDENESGTVAKTVLDSFSCRQQFEVRTQCLHSGEQKKFFK